VGAASAVRAAEAAAVAEEAAATAVVPALAVRVVRPAHAPAHPDAVAVVPEADRAVVPVVPAVVVTAAGDVPAVRAGGRSVVATPASSNPRRSV
jgi:hypothetical protein